MENELVELLSIRCPECEETEYVVMGIRDGYIYLICLNDDCGATIRFSFKVLDALSYPSDEVEIEQEPIRFKFPKETDKLN